MSEPRISGQTSNNVWVSLTR